jgi:hypothetical protein
LRRLACGLIALAVAGCAGDDPPSQQDYAEDAERICRQAEERLADIANEATTPQEVADAVDRVIEETRSSIDELQDLELPGGDARELAERFVRTQTDLERRGIPVLEDLRDALEARDEAAAQAALARVQRLGTERSDRVARRLGADACAG